MKVNSLCKTRGRLISVSMSPNDFSSRSSSSSFFKNSQISFLEFMLHIWKHLPITTLVTGKWISTYENKTAFAKINSLKFTCLFWQASKTRWVTYMEVMKMGRFKTKLTNDKWLGIPQIHQSKSAAWYISTLLFVLAKDPLPARADGDECNPTARLRSQFTDYNILVDPLCPRSLRALNRFDDVICSCS